MTGSASATIAASDNAPAKQRAWPILLLLALAMATGNIMLGVFAAVQEQAKAELGFSDVQMSLLNGLAVSIPLAALAIPVGLLVDRSVRVRLLLWTAIAWTAGTLLTAFAQSMTLLFVARMLGSLGANISTTIAISLAADICLPERRGRSLLLLTIGKYAGAGLAFALGGWLLGLFVERGGLIGLAPWRSIHLVLGIASLFVVAALAFLKEPPRMETRVGPSAPIGETFRELFSYWRFLVPLFIGQIGVLMADAAATIWAAPVLARTYGVTPQEFAGWLGGVIFGAGILGAIIGGIAADAGHRTGKRGGIVIAAIVGSIIALPAVLFPLAESVPLFGFALFVLLLGGTITGLVTATALAVLLPNELRGLSIGTFLAVGGLVAFGLAPTLVAMVSEWLGGEDYLATALALVGGVVSVLGCIGFIVAYRTAPEPIR
ncbi:MFS transporter [Altererythrobacter sp. SALINAS58]|uniref:MFS transporter n=1 Tax=Alteripontixanthobacter muriae TaxID=2705546 RepID=UPI001575C86D|nr:MFS transporter [Alteripontixanthobacter muriae]NTZ43201.1 MFS transporter [Alteripontixanthobacter muriae]